MRIAIKRGLDIPLKGKPQGFLGTLMPRRVALTLDALEGVRFKPLVTTNDRVKIGTPLVENKAASGMFFVSPSAGIVREICFGAKKSVSAVVIDCEDSSLYEEYGPLSIEMPREAILERFLKAGLFAHLCMRPFDRIADPKITPRDIFVNAIESRPFAPGAEAQVEGYESYFQMGLSALARLTHGKVHLVYREKSPSAAFTQAKDVEKHTAIGPHPIGTSSVHIHFIRPITHAEDIVWTLAVVDVICIGRMMAEGRYHPIRLISIAGEGILEQKRGFYRTVSGLSVQELTHERLKEEPCMLFSGDPLCGKMVSENGFLGSHTCFSALFLQKERKSLSFLRLSKEKYSSYRAFLSAHRKPGCSDYTFTTSQGGEERAFLDSTVYDRVMPMRIATTHLIRALLAEDEEKAIELGLYEIASEDFALASFVCPSKIEMVDIVRKALNRYAQEMGR